MGPERARRLLLFWTYQYAANEVRWPISGDLAAVGGLLHDRGHGSEKEEAKHDKKEEEKQIRLVVPRGTGHCQKNVFVNLLSHPSATQLRHHPVLERVLHVDELVHLDQHHRP